MLENKRQNHTVFRIAYHLCWIPKYRKKIFTSKPRERMKEIIFQIAYEYEFEIEEIEVMPDHIHLLISASPKWSPSKIIQTLKSKSAIQFFREFPEVKKKYFWGGKLWTSSYFVETVGNATHSLMYKYIKNQQKDLDQKLKKMKLF